MVVKYCHRLCAASVSRRSRCSIPRRQKATGDNWQVMVVRVAGSVSPDVSLAVSVSLAVADSVKSVNYCVTPTQPEIRMFALHYVYMCRNVVRVAFRFCILNELTKLYSKDQMKCPYRQKFLRYYPFLMKFYLFGLKGKGQNCQRAVYVMNR